MDNYNQQVKASDEISLKDLILMIKRYFFVLLNRWLLIGFIGILFGGYFLYSATQEVTTYSATLLYTAGEKNTLGVGGLIGGFLGKGRTDPLSKAQSIATTQRIGMDALFKKVSIDGKLDFLINHHGRLYEVEDFTPFLNSELSTVAERKVFKKIMDDINNLFLSQSLDEDVSMATIKITSISEDYSIELVNTYYESLVKFHKETEVGQQQQTLNALQSRADSIYGVIQSTAYSLANMKDRDKGIFWAVDKVPQTQATTELTFLTRAYEEIVKNLETIKFTVSSNTPSITAIDYPTTPLEPEEPNLIIKTIMGIFIGCFLAASYVLGQQILSDVMNEDNDDEHLVND